jgi:hypothetical protein
VFDVINVGKWQRDFDECSSCLPDTNQAGPTRYDQHPQVSLHSEMLLLGSRGVIRSDIAGSVGARTSLMKCQYPADLLVMAVPKPTRPKSTFTMDEVTASHCILLRSYIGLRFI